jgi:hypothetical protein
LNKLTTAREGIERWKQRIFHNHDDSKELNFMNQIRRHSPAIENMQVKLLEDPKNKAPKIKGKTTENSIQHTTRGNIMVRLTRKLMEKNIPKDQNSPKQKFLR